MAKRKVRNYTAVSKFNLFLQLLQGEKTRAEIAREHDIAKSLLYKVKENVGSGLVAGFEDEIVDVFDFQCAKEAFGRGLL